jgi:hypothetical protein
VIGCNLRLLLTPILGMNFGFEQQITPDRNLFRLRDANGNYIADVNGGRWSSLYMTTFFTF